MGSTSASSLEIVDLTASDEIVRLANMELDEGFKDMTTTLAELIDTLDDGGDIALCDKIVSLFDEE